MQIKRPLSKRSFLIGFKGYIGFFLLLLSSSEAKSATVASSAQPKPDAYIGSKLQRLVANAGRSLAESRANYTLSTPTAAMVTG